MSLERDFFYLAENREGEMLMALKPMEPGRPALWTRNPEEAIRHTAQGINDLQQFMGAMIGARKVLAS